MRHLDLFSGIGGFALATEWVWPDVEHVFCDNDVFSQAVLKKHWPNSPIYGDIKELAPPPADLVTGGFPCQPFSNAGKRRGTADDRHLWPEMLRVIRASAPRWVVGENVSGLLTWNDGMVLDTIISDLEGEGYEVWPFVIPAVAVDAPHRRDRVWIVAHRNELGRVHGGIKEHPAEAGQQAFSKPISSGANVPNTDSVNKGSPVEGFDSRRKNRKTTKIRPASGNGFRDFSRWAAEPGVGRVAHGVPNRVDRIISLGNAIVPQVAAEIFRAIKKSDGDK